MAKRKKVAINITLQYNGMSLRSLLDSDCDVFVLGRRILPDLSYQACHKNLLAANASPIPILGSALVSFRVAGAALQHQFLVSDAIEEIVLGSDWLDANNCTWDFETSTLWIKSLPTPVSVRLGSSSHRELVRRIHAVEDVVFRQTVNVLCR
jgi:hypothetical protein